MSQKMSTQMQKPFKCIRCDKAFRTKQHMVQHTRGHTKPFPCSFCDKSFASKQSLTQHIRTHTGEKPFSCHRCKAHFIIKQLLTKHLAKRNKCPNIEEDQTSETSFILQTDGQQQADPKEITELLAEHQRIDSSHPKMREPQGKRNLDRTLGFKDQQIPANLILTSKNRELIAECDKAKSKMPELQFDMGLKLTPQMMSLVCTESFDQHLKFQARSFINQPSNCKNVLPLGHTSQKCPNNSNSGPKQMNKASTVTQDQSSQNCPNWSIQNRGILQRGQENIAPMVQCIQKQGLDSNMYNSGPTMKTKPVLNQMKRNILQQTQVSTKNEIETTNFRCKFCVKVEEIMMTHQKIHAQLMNPGTMMYSDKPQHDLIADDSAELIIPDLDQTKIALETALFKTSIETEPISPTQ